MEDQQENVDSLLAHLAEELGMKDAEPYEIASAASIKMYQAFTRNGIKEQIDTAINFAQMSLRYEHDNLEITNDLLSNLGVFLGSRFERVGEMADLEEAIRITRQIVASTSKDSDLASCLNNLGVLLEFRYKRKKNIINLEEAIQIAQEVVTLTPKNHSDLAGRLNNLGNMLENRYEQKNNIIDLEKAIQVAREAVVSTSEDHSDLATRLNNLGNKLARRYQQKGDVTDLEEAIQAARKAVVSTPRDYSDLAGRLNNLGVFLENRYERTRNMADLEEAIQVAREAVVSTPEDHSDLAARLNNLGNKLARRYQRMEDMADLEEAIRVARNAIALTPEDHFDLARYLNNLGTFLELQYKRLEDISDLEEAIRVARQSVVLTSKSHFDLAGRLNNLGNKLEKQYQRTENMADLEEAIQVAREAVISTPEDYSDLADCLNSLGNKLGRRYQQTGEIANLVEANEVFCRSWTCYNSAPFTRIYAASQCLKMLFHLEQYDEAAKIAVSVIDLLPIVNARSLDREDRQHVVSRYSGIAADACGVLLQARGPETALQYLEKGRAVILGQMIDNWSDLSSLTKAHSELATKFKTLRDIINARSNHSSTESDRLLTAQRRRAAATELELCIRSIQGVPGQEFFMAVQSIEAMQACAIGGNVVVVNLSQLRSDAIILSPTSIRTIRLPSLSAADAEIWISKPWHGLESERGVRNKEYAEFLKWLWEVCVKDVLDAIDCMKNVSVEYLSRIWWIGTGLASSMPFHAAGDHSPGSIENTFSCVISSYAPSIKALSYSKSRCSAHLGLQLKALIATMPVTPGMKPGQDGLPGVLDEERSVMEILRHYTTLEKIEQPSAEAVIQRIGECNITHLACHGRTNHIDPSRSGLILQRKDESGSAVQNVLTVHDLSELNLQHAQLAYLSACSTAENKAGRLADEAIHVVSSFQIAGFPHVIGSLWPSGDRVCVKVSRGFYTSLVEQGVLRLDSKSIAVALHRSIVEVRAKHWKRPLNWAQFVHYGA